MDEVIRLLMVEKEIAGSSTWDARVRIFRRHHHVNLTKASRYAYLEGAIQVRNAVAHGLGRLTARQVLSDLVPRQLALVNVALVNEHVDLRVDNIVECADCATEFLLSVDVLALEGVMRP